MKKIWVAIVLREASTEKHPELSSEFPSSLARVKSLRRAQLRVRYHEELVVKAWAMVRQGSQALGQISSRLHSQYMSHVVLVFAIGTYNWSYVRGIAERQSTRLLGCARVDRFSLRTCGPRTPRFVDPQRFATSYGIAKAVQEQRALLAWEACCGAIKRQTSPSLCLVNTETHGLTH